PQGDLGGAAGQAGDGGDPDPSRPQAAAGHADGVAGAAAWRGVAMIGPGRGGGDATGESSHRRAGEDLDGALAPPAEAEVLDPPPGCAACQAELHDEVQLRDRESALGSLVGWHGRAGEYLGGGLAPDAETAFLDHLAGCAACQAELHDEVQLRDREAALRSA